MDGFSTPSKADRGQTIVEYLLVLGLTASVFGLLAPLLKLAISYASTRFASGLVALN